MDKEREITRVLVIGIMGFIFCLLGFACFEHNKEAVGIYFGGGMSAIGGVMCIMTRFSIETYRARQREHRAWLASLNLPALPQSGWGWSSLMFFLLCIPTAAATYLVANHLLYLKGTMNLVGGAIITLLLSLILHWKIGANLYFFRRVAKDGVTFWQLKPDGTVEPETGWCRWKPIDRFAVQPVVVIERRVSELKHRTQLCWYHHDFTITLRFKQLDREAAERFLRFWVDLPPPTASPEEMLRCLGSAQPQGEADFRSSAARCFDLTYTYNTVTVTVVFPLA